MTPTNTSLCIKYSTGFFFLTSPILGYKYSPITRPSKVEYIPHLCIEKFLPTATPTPKRQSNKHEQITPPSIPHYSVWDTRKSDTQMCIRLLISD